MVDFKNFKGEAKRLDDFDLPKLGAILGVGEDEIHAFIDVETRGTGFDEQGRPRILFERHKFYKYLPASKREAAVKAGLASKKAGGYGKESEQYGKLERAMSIDEKAALYACSWGLGQNMGFNHEVSGYDTVEEMILAFMEDEENQLEAAVQFILTNNLDDELRAHNWAGFARGYNGSDYARNKYDVKLAAAFAKWSKIKDTPYKRVTLAPAETQITKEAIERVQGLLRDRGYFEVGNVDGAMGKRTRNAILAFQADNDFTLSGEITDALLAELLKAPHREVSTERANATANDLKSAEGVKIGDTLKNVGGVVIAASGIGGVIDGTGDISEITNGIGQINGIWSAMADLSPWLIGIVAGGLALYFGSRFIREQVEAYREGRHV